MFFSKRAFNALSNSSRCSSDNSFVLLFVMLVSSLLGTEGQVPCPALAYLQRIDLIESYINGISLSSFLIINAKSSPSLFPLLAHRLAYPNSEFPASLVLRYLPLGRRRLHLCSKPLTN